MYPNTTKKRKEKRKRNIDLAVLPSYDKIKGISRKLHNTELVKGSS